MVYGRSVLHLGGAGVTGSAPSPQRLAARPSMSAFGALPDARHLLAGSPGASHIRTFRRAEGAKARKLDRRRGNLVKPTQASKLRKLQQELGEARTVYAQDMTEVCSMLNLVNQALQRAEATPDWEDCNIAKVHGEKLTWKALKILQEYGPYRKY